MPHASMEEKLERGNEKHHPASLGSYFDKISSLSSTGDVKSAPSIPSDHEFQLHTRSYNSVYHSLLCRQTPASFTMPMTSNQVPARDGDSKKFHPTSANANVLIQRNLGVSYANLSGAGNTSELKVFGSYIESPATAPNCKENTNEFGNWISTENGRDLGESAFHRSSTVDSFKSFGTSPWKTGSRIRHVQKESLNSLSATHSKPLSNISPNKSTSDPLRNKEIMGLKSWRDTSTRPGALASNRTTLSDDTSIEKALQKYAAIVPAHIQGLAVEIQEKQALIEQQNGPGTVQSFRPSFSALQRFGFLPDLDAVRSAISASQFGGSGKYLGDMRLETNRSANIPDDQNCALWILGLPANVNYTTLLRSIRQVGKVYATVINRPTGFHTTSAAKIIFFNRFEAEIMFNLIAAGKFRVMGQPVVDVRWNNIKTGSYPSVE